MKAYAVDMTSEELGFVVACIDGVASRLRQNIIEELTEERKALWRR